MFNRFSLQLLSCSLVLLLIGCAQMVAPTGGTKDAAAPVVVDSKPDNKTTEFNSPEIIVRFDEYIQLSDVDDQLIVSPPFTEKPDITVDGKQIRIKQIPSLQKNTTYTMHFGNSISDVHERNILSNFSFVFSTGSTLDSLFVAGFIKNGYTNKPEQGYTVALYQDSAFNDSTFYLQKPLYLSKTDPSGFFQINNLPNSVFKIFAFKDDNKNLLYNANEPFCIYNDAVQLNDTVSKINLFSSEGNKYPVNWLIDSFSVEQGKFVFVTYKAQDLQIIPLKADSFIQWSNPGTNGIDTIVFYHHSGLSDTSLFRLKTSLLDTIISIKPKRQYKPSKPLLTLPKLVHLNETVKLQSNHPIAAFKPDTAFVQLTEDSVLIFPKMRIDSLFKFVEVIYEWKEGKTYRLQLADSCLKDIYGQYHKKYYSTWTAPKVQDYSLLTLNIVMRESSGPYIVELWNEIETERYYSYYIHYSQQITAPFILPGKYKIKVIDDWNRNKKWDTGSLVKQTQPEAVFYYPDIISLKANWDLEQTIDITKLVN